MNPNSGPGDQTLPGHDYESEVPKLNAAPNVCTIGYVRIDYCRKPLHDVCEEIDRFAGWVTEHGTERPGLAVHGIYVDETPNHYSAGRALYLEALHKHIKSRPGIQGQRLVSRKNLHSSPIFRYRDTSELTLSLSQPLHEATLLTAGPLQVVHNPGTPPDAELASPAIVEIVITCEEPYEKYAGDEVQKRLQDYYCHRSRSGYQISGVPVGEIASVTHELRHRAAYVFATSLVEDFYESFGECWKGFVQAMELEQSD